MRTSLLLSSVVVFAAACGESAPPPPPEPTCDIALDKLDGRTFVMLEATPDGDVENAMARVKFVSEDGALHAKYTAKSLANVYDYTCETKEAEVVCRSEFKAEYACKALEVTKVGGCTPEALREVGATQSDEDLKKAIDAAMEQVKKAREAGGDTLKKFKFLHNNLGNPVQGILYAKVRAEACQLMVDDMAALVYNGKRKEDFNPVGTNAFVASSQDFIFEDCPQGRVLADMTTAEAPKNAASVPAERLHEVGKPVHYHYVGPDAVKAEDSCTYTIDTYANWKPVGKDLAVTADGGKVRWSGQHTWADGDLLPVGGGKKGGIFHMVRKKSCEGKAEQIDVTCNAAAIN